MEKIGLVLEGGASRGVFTAGVMGFPQARATRRIWYRNRSGVPETP